MCVFILLIIFFIFLIFFTFFVPALGKKNAKRTFAETVQDSVRVGVILPRGHFSFHSDLDRLQKYLSSIFSGSAHFLKTPQLGFLLKICISYKNLTGWPSFLGNY